MLDDIKNTIDATFHFPSVSLNSQVVTSFNIMFKISFECDMCVKNNLNLLHLDDGVFLHCFHDW